MARKRGHEQNKKHRLSPVLFVFAYLAIVMTTITASIVAASASAETATHRTSRRTFSHRPSLIDC